jgi:hypothetical protein
MYVLSLELLGWQNTYMVLGVGCKENDIDVTTSAFDQLEARAVGRTTVTWAWLDVDM